jgi:hypothetical protein
MKKYVISLRHCKILQVVLVVEFLLYLNKNYNVKTCDSLILCFILSRVWVIKDGFRIGNWIY